MKSESLVIADQHAAVNSFPGRVHTARRAMNDGRNRSRLVNDKESGVSGKAVDWGKVVTR